MARYAYDRLTAQDNSFLLMERGNVRMHVASVLVHDIGPLRAPDGGVDIDAVKQSTAAYLHLVPRYRQRLQQIPFFDHAVWVDDPHFDLDYHIRHTALPRPGSAQQLKYLAARIMAQPLDRQRPLWETWVVEGLEGGEQFALIVKIHHCMIDGMSGVDLAYIAMSPTPEAPELAEPPPYHPRPAPSALELWRAEMGRQAGIPFQVLRDFRQFTQDAEDLGEELKTRARSLVGLLGMAAGGDETPLNGTLGPHRRFDWLACALDDLKAIRRSWECTVNDVVLTLVTGAIREYLTRHGVDPGGVRFRVSSPVSVRSAEERGKLGNRVSSWILELPIGEEAPRRQLEAIREETRRLKEDRSALGVQMMLRVAEWTPSTLLSLGAQSMSGPINTIVTNVPGPQVPLFFRGARVRETYPMVPLMEGMGLGIAVTSYAGRMDFGFVADPDIVPDLHDFRAMVQRALERVAREAGVTLSVPEPAPKPIERLDARIGMSVDVEGAAPAARRDPADPPPAAPGGGNGSAATK